MGFSALMKQLCMCLLICAVLGSVCAAQMPQMPGIEQDNKGQAPKQQCMPGMDMPGCDSGQPSNKAEMHPHSFLEEIQHHGSSGTSAEPNSTPTPMLMSMRNNWIFMLHGVAFITDEQQSGPRGADKFFSTNWIMPMAQRNVGPGQLTLRTMFSLEPATVSRRQYPLLFQQGETAFGKAIVDGQHPHDFFMEIAGLYDIHFGEHSLISFYAAPVGDPAIGPTAYPHRASAAEDPVGTLGHHQEDSTHIAADVLTMGVTHRMVRVEASGFHGREPDENRWNIDQGVIDSWSTRFTIQPGQNWSGQYSYAQIHSPEALFPDEDQHRMTTSLMYNKPIGEASARGNWASTLAWGRTRDSDGAIENSYLLESTLRFAKRNTVWTRMENAGRSNELLLGEKALPHGFTEQPLTHVQAYTFGYDREFLHASHLSTALGAQITAYGVGKPLQAAYGQHPVGGLVFLRLRLR
jgi:hypothetical protein